MREPKAWMNTDFHPDYADPAILTQEGACMFAHRAFWIGLLLCLALWSLLWWAVT